MPPQPKRGAPPESQRVHDALSAFLPLEPLPAPPVHSPPEQFVSEASLLPTPPDLLEHVTREAECRMPAEHRTPLLLLRVSMLLQDAVEAACMCAKAHIDASLLAKHLLGNEQHQDFISAQAALTASNSAAPAAVGEFASAVASTVGEVRHTALTTLCRRRARRTPFSPSLLSPCPALRCPALPCPALCRWRAS
jgi:hypothetical protein